MKVWSVLLALSFALLSGCLVTFKDPIPTRDTAPPKLLGTWTSKNAWGEPLELGRHHPLLLGDVAAGASEVIALARPARRRGQHHQQDGKQRPGAQRAVEGGRQGRS